ncbi:MAG: terminase family protein, partial [Bacteroidaceae bacterium]
MEEEKSILDLVFAKLGIEVYTYEYAEQLRDENLLLGAGDKIYNILPQAGFQEEVLLNEADVKVIGGNRGGGKSYVMELSPLYNIHIPLFSCHGFRKEEDDIRRGLWKTSKFIYTDVAVPKESEFQWTFPSGATSKYEHLQNEKEVDRRFRGAEMPEIIIDELPQITFETFFTLLASNRNTLGVKNQFTASCNPVSRKNWVYKFISWYIDEDTNMIIPERSGKIRYFYKFGKDISEIVWGNSKEEVYEKAQQQIDEIWNKDLEDGGGSKFDLINSFCFIEGSYAQNKIFRKKDPRYLGNLSQQGGRQSVKDIKGIWGDDEETEAIVTSTAYDDMFDNTYQTSGKRTAVADVALSGDDFVIGAFDGNHLFDVEVFTNVKSEQAKTLVQNFIDKNHIHEINFLYDATGIGHFMDSFSKSYSYTGNSASSDKEIWTNKRSECSERYATNIKEGRISVDRDLQKRRFGNMTFREHLESERSALKRKITTNGKYQI